MFPRTTSGSAEVTARVRIPRPECAVPTSPCGDGSVGIVTRVPKDAADD